MQLRVFILEDDGTLRTQLRAFVQRTNGLVLAGECSDPLEAGALISQHPVDIIFLDIGLPVLDGYAFLRSLACPPLVIVVSGDTSHAARAYEHSAVDFLRKPVTYERFMEAVERTRKRLLLPTSADAKKMVQGPLDRILDLHVGNSMEQVPIRSIELVQSMGNYVKVHTRDNGHLLAMNTMANMEDALPKAHFVRIHRSYIIALDAVSAVGSRSVEWRKGQLPLGGNYRRNALLALAGRA